MIYICIARMLVAALDGICRHLKLALNLSQDLSSERTGFILSRHICK